MAVQAATIIGGSPAHQPKAASPGAAFALPVVVPKGVIKVEWAAGATGDTGEWVQLPQFGDKCVEVTGTTVTSVSIEGSNEVDGSGNPINPFILHDPTVTGLITFTAAGIRQILESPQFIRPLFTTAAAVKVTVVGRKQSNASGA